MTGKVDKARREHTLNKNEFDVLREIFQHGFASQRDLGQKTSLSLGTVNTALGMLESAGLLERSDDAKSKGFAVTEQGRAALTPYKVDNAVILAAGLSSRFAPISYEKPKGLLQVRGEVLIERQIRQLKEAGVEDITVVVGFKKEQYFYLEDEFGITIAINEEYAERNNNSSLKVVADKLANTYICSSDNYFTVNPFNAYEWGAYYAAQFVEGETEEWCLTLGSGKRIIDVTIGGSDSWYMLGHAYFDKAFSRAFVAILEEEYDLPETKDKLWEKIYTEHIAELDMRMKPYPAGVINEFDSIDELRDFDPDFLTNIDSEIFTNIETVLGCNRAEIDDIYPLKQGITNLSCHFRVGDEQYVYRHPGVGTDELVDRSNEADVQSIACTLGLDDTFVYEDAASGWKISRFIEDCEIPNIKDDEELAQVMQLARTLHDSGMTTDAPFDFYEESRRYEELLGGRDAIDVIGFSAMAARIDRLHELTLADDTKVCLSHNDFWPQNILKDKNGRLHLIDWEYSGMADYASDFGTFVVEAQLAEDDAMRALRAYFKREPTPQEIRHNFAYVAFAGWCWYVWSLYKEFRGDMVGEWLHIYYKFGKDYLAKALKLYGLEENALPEKRQAEA